MIPLLIILIFAIIFHISPKAGMILLSIFSLAGIALVIFVIYFINMI